MNLNGPVVKSRSQFELRNAVFFPEDNIVEKILKSDRDLLPVAAEVEVLPSKLARPSPDIAKHLFVKALHPSEREGRGASAGRRRQILNNSLANVLGFQPIQF
jgi:hypothetical protein